MSGFRSAVILTAVNLFSQGARFLFQVLLSRSVSPEALGLYQLVMSVMPVLMSLTAVGFVSACSQLTARYRATGNHKAAKQALRLCLAGFFLAFSLVALISLPLREWIAGALLGEPRVSPALALLLPLVLLTGVENLHKNFFYGAGAVVEPALTEVGEQIIRTGAVLGLLWYCLPETPAGAVTLILWGMILCEVFSACTLTLLFHRAVGPYPPGAGIGRKTLSARIAAIAFPVGLNALLGNLMGAWTSALIPRALVRAGADQAQALSAFGILRGMTLPLLSLPTAVIGALCLVLLPKMAQAHALGRHDLCRSRLNKALTATALWVMPTSALTAVTAPVLGDLLFHQSAAGDGAIPFALAVALSCFESVLTVSLNALGRQARVAWHSLLCGCIQLALTWSLMALGGGLGGYALAMILSSLLGLWLDARVLRQVIGMKARWFDWLVAPGLAALLSALCANLLLPLLASLGELGACGGTLAFGLVVYLAALAAMGVFPRKSVLT